MKNKKIMKNNKEDLITPWWSISDGWNRLTYEQKLEHYWKYEYSNGVRMLPRYDDPVSKK